MSGAYMVTPRRYSTADDDSVASTCDNADFWTVVDARTGARVCRCETADLAAVVVSGLAALDAVDEMKAEREACRMAACFALGTDSPTLESAIAALCAGHESLLLALLAAAPEQAEVAQ